MARPFVITIVSVASTLFACGGSTSSDHPASGGSTATGGKSGSGNAAGSGGVGNVSGGGSGGAVVGGFGGSGAFGGSVGGFGGYGGATCPPNFPQNQTPCGLVSGTTCMYDQGQCCPPWEATCVNGVWQAISSMCDPPPPPPQSMCPGTPPTSGSACPVSGVCAPDLVCNFGQCIDGSPLTIATCTGGSWNVMFSNCQPMPCEQLSACDCFDRPDCEATTDTCLCPCDFNCPGDPPCACDCGGGQFLGCKPKNPFP